VAGVAGVAGTAALRGKTVIVTGGARGIGRAYAWGLASAGAAVVIADVLEDEGRDTAKSIEAGGGRALFVAVDVTDVESTERMAATAAREFDGIDILVNNAAVFAGLDRTSLVDLPVDRWARVMDVNVRGVWLGIRAVVPYMRERGGGAIVNQSSVAAFGLNGLLDYATSKAAVIGLTKSAARELAADGIRVNTICPGGVATEAAAGYVGGDYDAIERNARESQLIREAIRPEDMVEPMLFLATDSSRFMTGQTIVVDGGRFFLG
jgi:NAD(P)-dependent dehydrogenase (short-subunit alcohol dehydrogenase family)